MWDIYIVSLDPWLIFFMVTVLLVNCREAIMEVKEDKADLISVLKSLPSQLEADDIPDLVTLAQVYSTRTPPPSDPPTTPPSSPPPTPP